MIYNKMIMKILHMNKEQIILDLEGDVEKWGIHVACVKVMEMLI